MVHRVIWRISRTPDFRVRWRAWIDPCSSGAELRPQPGGFPLGTLKAPPAFLLHLPRLPPHRPSMARASDGGRPDAPSGHAHKRRRSVRRPRTDQEHIPRSINQFPHTPSVLDLVRPRLGESPLAQPRRSPPLPEPSSTPKSFPVPPRSGPHPASSSRPSKPHCPRHAWSLKGPKAFTRPPNGTSRRPAPPLTSRAPLRYDSAVARRTAVPVALATFA